MDHKIQYRMHIFPGTEYHGMSGDEPHQFQISEVMNMCNNGNNGICSCISNNWWWIVILLLLFCFCGNNNDGCGCGC